MLYFCETHVDVLNEVLQSSDLIQSEMRKSLKKTNPRVEVAPKNALELILGKVDLSQRAYENLRSIFKKANIILPPWKVVMKYEATVNVGPIKQIHVSPCDCGGFETELKDTLQRIVSNPVLMEMCEFMTQERQQKLFTFLKERSPSLYRNLDDSRKTIFLRLTGRCLAKLLSEG